MELFGIRIQFIFKTGTYSVFGPNLLFGPTLPPSQTGSVSWTFDVTSGCLGALTPGNAALVRDQATGLRLGPGELGEICVKTMTCMKVIGIMM